MHKLSKIIAAAVASLLAATGATAATVTQNFASSSVLCTTSALISPAGCNWYGAQHGVAGPSGTMAWNSGAGSDGASGFIGYSPTTRVGVTLFNSGFGTLSLSDIVSVSIDAKNTDGIPAGQASQAVQLALRTSGGQWYVSDFGYAATDDTKWSTLIYDTLENDTFRAYNTDGILPNQATGNSSLLAGNTQIDAIGFYTGYSGQNNPNSGYVLRYDNYVLQTTVPEPGTLALVALALVGAGTLARRKG